MERWKVGTISLVAVVAILLVVPSIADTPLYPRPAENPCTAIPPAMAERASVYESPTPYERFEAADLVVIGTIEDSTAKCDGPNVMTYMHVGVEDSLKNPQNLSSLTAKVYGGTIGDHTIRNSEFTRLFEKDDRVFLYLNEEGDAYAIDYYSGTLVADGSPDYSISGKEIIETFRLEFDTQGDYIVIQPGNSKEVTLNLTSYFGYDSLMNLRVSSFAHLSDSGVFNSANLTRLPEFGLSMEPAEKTITLTANGTEQTTFIVKVSEDALPGTYHIYVSSVEEDLYSNIAGGLDNNYISINVPEKDIDA